MGIKGAAGLRSVLTSQERCAQDRDIFNNKNSVWEIWEKTAMEIVDFNFSHVVPAAEIALAAYKEEREKAAALPKEPPLPDLTPYAQNGLGVAAVDQGRLVGFLCCIDPFDHAFGSTDVRGVFSPMGANGVAGQDRGRIYAAMYAKAAEKWVAAGAVSHGICLYAHDEAAQGQFFKYGFGLRCVDAVRPVEEILCKPCSEYSFRELGTSGFSQAYPLEAMLNRHCCQSPFFLNRALPSRESFCRECAAAGDRCFIALFEGNVCAYLKLSKAGETFISQTPGYWHISGAFCLPEHRGKGVYQNLINYVISTLQGEGCAYLGVDFESINPGAHRFWTKYFTAYTHGVVRRIDERILAENIME